MRKGFTLIELVFVIVILGILAAVALPRFGDVTDQAQESKEKADFASILSGIKMVHAQAILDNNGTNVTIDGTTITLGGVAAMYPRSLDNTDGTHLGAGARATFGSVLERTPPGWNVIVSNNNNARYRGPARHCFDYNVSNGRFAIRQAADAANNCIAAPANW